MLSNKYNSFIKQFVNCLIEHKNVSGKIFFPFYQFRKFEPVVGK